MVHSDERPNTENTHTLIELVGLAYQHVDLSGRDLWKILSLKELKHTEGDNNQERPNVRRGQN